MVVFIPKQGMVKVNINNKFIYLLICCFILLQGCVGIQSFPTIARGGDTITLAVGSPDGMTKTNTTAQFVSDIDGSTENLPIRSIIRIRPDQTSKAALFDSLLNAEDYYTGHSQWLSIIIIDLPEILTVGTGRIDINSTASYGSFPVGINDIPIAIEIIEGVGTQNEFFYNNNFGGIGSGNLSSLEPLPQVVFQTQNTTSILTFAAAEIKVNVPTDSVPDRDFRIIADDFYTKNARSQLQMSWTRNGDEFTVNFISPNATMMPRQLRFSVVLNPRQTFLATQEPSISSVRLYDVNGEETVLIDNMANALSFQIVAQ